MNPKFTPAKLVLAGLFGSLVFTLSADAIDIRTSHGDENLAGLNAAVRTDDLIQGLIPTVLFGLGTNNGFRTDPPATGVDLGSTPDDLLPAYTDGAGFLSDLTGLLADNSSLTSGQILQQIEYALPDAAVQELRFFAGNRVDLDARAFLALRVEVSADGGSSYFGLGLNDGYFQSDASGSLNEGSFASTLLEIAGDGGASLAEGVDFLRISFYASGDLSARATDPFDGTNPYTGLDDGEAAAELAPLVLEIDVLAVPEPATTLIAVALALFSVRRGVERRRRELAAI